MGGVGDRTVDVISTDHAPHPLKAKHALNPLDAPSGVPGVETMLPLLLSCMEGGPEDAEGEIRPIGGAPETDIQPQDILRLCFTNPNRIFHLRKECPPCQTTGLGEQTGLPAEAQRRRLADLILVNPGQTWKIYGKELCSKCGWTPYEGWEVRGKVVRVI